MASHLPLDFWKELQGPVRPNEQLSPSTLPVPQLVDLLAVLRVHQAHSRRLAFALAVPSVWNTHSSFPRS